MPDWKSSLQEQGLKLLSDPRVKELMQDERVVKGMMRVMQLRTDVQEQVEKKVEDVAKSLNLATADEVKDLRRQLKKMERELEKARDAAKKAQRA